MDNGGRHDGKVDREEALVHARLLANATTLPVSADLENGFGDTPEEIAKTIRQAGETGLAGASIEDFTGRMVATKDAFESATSGSAAVSRVCRRCPSSEVSDDTNTATNANANKAPPCNI